MKIPEINTKPRMVSIVIANYFTGTPGGIIKDEDESLWFARKCFERIKEYTTLPYELVLIDNGCTVGKELLQEYADTIIINKENLGFARGYNQGFRAAKGDWVVCMNNDIFVWQGWLEALIRTFEDNQNCGVAMPALMKQTKNGLGALTFKEIDLNSNYDKYGPGAEFGSCWLVRRDIMDKVGLFDENFKVGMGEDRDYWRRLRNAGYETYRTHKTRVFHQGNVTIAKIKDRRKYTYPNRAYLKKMREMEADFGRELSEKEKKVLKVRIERDYEEHWGEGSYLKDKWGY